MTHENRVSRSHLSYFSPLALSTHAQSHTSIPRRQATQSKCSEQRHYTFVCLFTAASVRTNYRAVQYTSATDDECSAAHTHTHPHMHTSDCPSPCVVFVVRYFAIHFAERMTFYHPAQVHDTHERNCCLCFFFFFAGPTFNRFVCAKAKSRIRTLRKKL